MRLENPRPSDFIPAAYSIVVVQPNTLCNLNCDYCYLPGAVRRTQNLMPVQVARKLAADIAAQHERLGVPRVSISWHCGEPTSTPPGHMRALLEEFEPLRRAGLVEHVLQTNGTLIDDDWCEIFTDYGISVGVSIDGPRESTRHRVDWSGREVFDRVMRGMRRLRAAGVYYDVIGVVGPETIAEDPAELIRFYEGLGVEFVALNIEEAENASVDRRLVTGREAHEFWRAVIAHLRESGSRLRIRDLTTVSTWLATTAQGLPLNQTRQIVPTVSWKGEVVLLSPELADADAPEHNNFVVGNVLVTPLSDLVGRMDQVGYVREFARGLAACRDTCSFWEFCRGSHASNRFFEHGTFAATETSHCRGSIQAPVTAMLSLIKEDEMPATTTVQTWENLLEGLVGDPAKVAVTDHANWFQSGGGGLAALTIAP
jgi:uncharacterized protein